MLAATLALGAVVAALWKRPVLTFVLVLLAGISKETTPPLLALLALVAARDSPGLLPPRRMWGSRGFSPTLAPCGREDGHQICDWGR